MHHRVDPALDRVVEDVETHVAFDPPGPQVDAPVTSGGPGMGAHILGRVGAELVHQAQNVLGVPELLEHDPGGRDPLLEAGREVDAVGEAGGTRQSANRRTRPSAASPRRGSAAVALSGALSLPPPAR